MTKFDTLVKEALKQSTTCEFSPLDAYETIDAGSLADDTLHMHYKFDTLEAEESDIPERIQKFDSYTLKLVKINKIQDVDSVDNTSVYIDDDNIEEIKDQILKTNKYPPIILDIKNNIIDGYHRVFALKQLGCENIWAYTPNQPTRR